MEMDGYFDLYVGGRHKIFNARFLVFLEMVIKFVLKLKIKKKSLVEE